MRGALSSMGAGGCHSQREPMMGTMVTEGCLLEIGVLQCFSCTELGHFGKETPNKTRLHPCTAPSMPPLHSGSAHFAMSVQG